MTMMTADTAAERIHGFIRKHPGVSHADISFAFSMRRQTRQASMRLLVASGRIVGTLGTDGKTLEWRPREPHRAEPASEPRHEPAGEAVTVIAPAAALGGGKKSPFDLSAEEFFRLYLDDDLGVGGPS